MPTLFRIRGYRFFFYAKEGTPLEPVHVHVESGDETAELWLRPRVELARNNGYDPRTLRRLAGLVAERADEIEERWNVFFRDSGDLR